MLHRRIGFAAARGPVAAPAAAWPVVRCFRAAAFDDRPPKQQQQRPRPQQQPYGGSKGRGAGAGGKKEEGGAAATMAPDMIIKVERERESFGVLVVTRARLPACQATPPR